MTDLERQAFRRPDAAVSGLPLRAAVDRACSLLLTRESLDEAVPAALAALGEALALDALALCIRDAPELPPPGGGVERYSWSSIAIAAATPWPGERVPTAAARVDAASPAPVLSVPLPGTRNPEYRLVGRAARHRSWSAEELHLLDLAAVALAGSISRTRASDAASRLQATLAAVADVGRVLAQGHALPIALRECARLLGEALLVDRATVFRHEHPQGYMQGPVIGFVEAEWTGPDIVPMAHLWPADLRAGMDPTLFERVTAGEPIELLPTSLSEGPTREFNLDADTGSMLIVPIRLGDRIWGNLCIDHVGAPRGWSERELAALKTAAAAVAGAVERDRLTAAVIEAERARTEESQRIVRHLQAVAAGSRRLVDASEFEPALREWLAEMGEAAGAARATYYDIVTHVESGIRTLRALAEWTREGLGDSCRISFAEPVVVDPRGAEDVIGASVGTEIVAFHVDGIMGSTRAFLESQGNATVLTVPIRMHGETRFALSLDYLHRREPSEAERTVLQTAADSLVAVLRRREAEAARLDAERERSALLAAVNEAGTRLLTPPGTSPPIGEALAVVGAAMRLDSFVYGVFEEPDADSALGYIRWTDEWRAGEAIRSVFDPSSPRRANLADQALHMPGYKVGHAAWFDDTAALPLKMREYLESFGARAGFGVPVHVDATYVGSLSGVTAAPRKWSAADVQALHLLAAAIGSALSRERQVKARIETEATRAAEAQTAAAALARRRDLLEAVVAASDQLLAAERVTDGACEIVSRIGSALGVDRVLVGRFLPPDAASDVGYVHFFTEWTSPGIPRQTDDPALATFDMAHYLDFLGSLRRGEAVQIITDEIADGVGRQEQESTGALSQFQYPVMVDGELWGTLGADDCRTRRIWDDAEIATLRLVASAIGSVASRERLAEARLAAERELAQEKARMAREIHDTLAQGFTGVIMQMNATEDAMESNDPNAAAHHTALAIEHARMGLAEARRSVYALRPPLLDRGDLADALRTVASRMFDGLSSSAEIRVQGTLPPLPEAASVEIFRISQEALGNALRHARAGTVTLTLDATVPRRLRLEIADDGVGFDPVATRSAGGFGLLSMHERADRLGSRLDVLTAPGEGTRVSLTVDLSAVVPASRPGTASLPSLLPDLR